MSNPKQIASLEQLESIYGEPLQRSLLKEIDYISDHYRAFIEAAPFVIIATSGPESLDCSPRGDPPGFVRVTDKKTVLIPDRRGNNRVDSLRNIIQDPRISLLFLIPGVGETMRINGRAEIRIDPDLLESFAMQDKLPRSVIKVTVDTVYYQCPKALVRSELWAPGSQIDRSTLPRNGDMIAALSKETFDADGYEASYPEHMNKTIY